MKKLIAILKKELMLTVSVAAAVIALFITPPSLSLLADIDWKTLVILFMMLTVLEGFKKENIFLPLIRLAGGIRTLTGVTFFLVFGVFFSSMFVTNDVSLIIFVPLTIIIFRAANKERLILPVISMENIAAVRGSMLTPFGSPQNLFIFGKSGVSVWQFLLHMLPLSLLSAFLLSIFIVVIIRFGEKKTDSGSVTAYPGRKAAEESGEWKPESRRQRIVYLCLFALVIATIVTRTPLWWLTALIVTAAVLIFDARVLIKTDYVLLLTFFCFFIFSSSIAANPTISDFLRRSVAGNEYWWAIGISQIISNVPASIVLYPFTVNVSALLYGADTAGLVTVIGSLASVINYRIYVREYPGNGLKFLKVFTCVSLAFFAFVVLPGFFLSGWHFC